MWEVYLRYKDFIGDVKKKRQSRHFLFNLDALAKNIIIGVLQYCSISVC